MTIEVPPTEVDVPYWRAVTFDKLVLDGYIRSTDARVVEHAPGEDVLADTGDAVSTDGSDLVPGTATSG